MREDVNKLMEILQKECRLHIALCETAREMNTALRQEDAAAVRANSSRYDEYTSQVEQLEEDRLIVCDTLAGALGMGERHPNLALIARALPVDLRDALESVQGELKATIKELSKVNISNQILLHEAIDNNEKTMRVLTVAGTARFSGYHKAGTMDSTPVRRNIINQTA